MGAREHFRRFVPDDAVPDRAQAVAEHKAAVARYLACGGRVQQIPPGVMATAPVSLNAWERKTLAKLGAKEAGENGRGKGKHQRASRELG